jgi:ATP-binding cassette subfamily B protein
LHRAEERAKERFKKHNEEWYNVDIASAKITQVFPCVTGFAISCGTVLIWAVGGRWALVGDVSPGTLVSFISYASLFYGPVDFFAHLSDSYQSALSSTERVFDILDAESEESAEDGIKPTRLEGKIEFRHVNFSFDKTKKTLTDINVTINPGDIVGIVGTTGSGKSTLINLLLRFYDHYEGEILVDGVNIMDIKRDELRKNIAIVLQDTVLFSDTIENNIKYANPEASDEQMIHAAEMSNSRYFIERLPEKYKTFLKQAGSGLSQGQRQLLAIARAILADPKILILDEATSSVDTRTEKRIQDAMVNLMKNRTSLIIAHRLSTIRDADKIVVLDQGRVVEIGSHDELLEKQGRYYTLYMTQFAGNQI